MKTKTILLTALILVILLIAIIYLFNYQITTEHPESNNEVKPPEEKTFFSLKILDDFISYNDTDEFLWNNLNVSTNLTKQVFLTNRSIEQIIEFYSNNTNLGNYTLYSSKIAASQNDSKNITFGSAKMKKNDSGIYLAARTVNETINVDAKTIVGFAFGDWSMIIACGVQ